MFYCLRCRSSNSSSSSSSTTGSSSSSSFSCLCFPCLQAFHHQHYMKESELLEYSKPVLAGAVKLSQRKQLVDAAGHNWHDWVQAQPTGKKLSDPRRYSTQQLAAFLGSLKTQKPDPRAPDKPLVKPSKLLKRYLPWLALKLQHDKPTPEGADQQQLKADPVWQLMQRTRAHPRFHQWYSFDSYDKGWVCTGRPEDNGGDNAAAAAATPPSPAAAAAGGGGRWKLLGLDCEMCKTADSDKELLQVAVVDEQDTLLMQELVLPSAPVLDYRTELTGIQASDLQGVTLTRKAAAKRISKLLTPHTVLVGHGLHHDLAALQLDHPWVIDTSIIFTFKGLSSFIPSLALLSEQLLGAPLRGRDPSAPLSTTQPQQQHDSREDASVALALVKLELQREGQPSPALDPPDLKVDKDDLAKLCVHRLPPQPSSSGAGSSSSSSSSLAAVAAAVKASLALACRKAGAAAAAEAVEGAAVEQPGDTSKQLLYLVFQHAGVANDVFAALPGSAFTDSVGRHSKRQAMKDSNHKVVVRKMACHNGLAFGRDKAADRGAKDSRNNKKKRKAPGGGGGGGGKSSKKSSSRKKGKKA